MCHIRKYVIFWYEKKKVEAFSFFFHIFIKNDGRRRDRDISIEIQMKLDILPFQKRSFPQPLVLLHVLQSITFSKKKRNVKKNQLELCCCCPLCAKIQNLGSSLNIFCFCYYLFSKRRLAVNMLTLTC